MRMHPTILFLPVVVTVLAACGTDGTAPEPAPTTVPAPAETSVPTEVSAPTETSVQVTSERTPSPASPTEHTTSALAGNGQCLDPTSAAVSSALDSLSDDGFTWGIENATDAPIGNCPTLMWLVVVGGNSAAAPEHVLFFAEDRYLGTGTSEAYAYTSVASATDTTVTVQYRWLAGDEPFCCPTGGPAEVTYEWDGSQIVMGQSLPQDMLNSYGP